MSEPSELNLWARQWRAERIRKAAADYRERAGAYDSLKDKTTDYARSIKMSRDVCAQVLAVWQASPVDLPSDAARTTGGRAMSARDFHPFDEACYCGKHRGMHRYGDECCPNPKWKCGNGEPQWWAGRVFTPWPRAQLPDTDLTDHRETATLPNLYTGRTV